MKSAEYTIQEYMDAFSGSSPVPGGGGASAVTGAMAASAALMVCALTSGKKKFAAIEPELAGMKAELEDAKGRLLRLADKDAEVFEPIAAAYHGTQYSESEMNALYCAAAGVPLEVMRISCGLLKHIRFLAENGSALAVSDAGDAAAFARAAISGALLNVCINTKYMSDREEAAGIRTEADKMFAEGVREADAIFAEVQRRIG